MLQVSRDSSLKIPKQIEVYEKSSNGVDDTVAVKKSNSNSKWWKIKYKRTKRKSRIRR